MFYFHIGPLPFDDKAKKLLTPEAKQYLFDLAARLESLPDFTSESVEGLFRVYAEEKALKLGAVAQPLRAALTGSTISPPIFGVAALLGKQESLKEFAPLNASRVWCLTVSSPQEQVRIFLRATCGAKRPLASHAVAPLL